MLKWLRRILAVVAILIALSVLLPLAYIEGTCRPSSGVAAASAPAVTLPAIDEPGYRRKLNNTFFTFPEWYIVYSFEDFGRFLDRSSESHFNYLGHIFGFWQSFCTINRAVPATGESLSEVKTMIYVIGISYSAEYAIKGLYENTIGRVFEWIRGEKRTPQDEFGRAVLQGADRNPAGPAGSGFWPCGNRRQSRHPHYRDCPGCRQARHRRHDGAVFAAAGCPVRVSQGRPESQDRPPRGYQPRTQGQG